MKNSKSQKPEHKTPQIFTDRHSVVIGNGWAALAAVGFLTRDPAKQVTWVTGSGARILPPLHTLEASHEIGSLELWMELARRFGIELPVPQTGSYLREFRNKAFREPAWTKAPTPEERKQVMEEVLWPAERRMANLFDAHLGMTLAELEEKIRAALDSAGLPNLRKVDDLPLEGFKFEDESVRAILLGSGEEIPATQVIYADRWALLGKMQGMPKALPFVRHRSPVGILQATFTHSAPIASGVSEAFFGSLHRESGEEFDRHVWGYFSTQEGEPARSFWTVCLSPEEVEDNHEIAKRLRRMKSALDRMFTGSAWIPEGKSEFMATVSHEQVRFEESFLFSEGDSVLEPVQLPKLGGISFLTDGCGPSLAIRQAGLALNVQPEPRPEPQAESVDSNSATGLE